MRNLYLIPANANSGKLIFSLFTRFDLILASSGSMLSIILLLVFKPGSFQLLILLLLPMLICVALVMPIPHYHNVYVVIKDLIEFLYKRRNYKWEGWCCVDEFK